MKKIIYLGFALLSVLLLLLVIVKIFLATPVDIISEGLPSEVRLGNRVAFSYWLSKLGYTNDKLPIKVLPLGLGWSKEIEVSKVKIVLVNEPQAGYGVASGGEIVVSGGFIYNQDSKELEARLHVSRIEGLDDKIYLEAWEATILDVLYRINTANSKEEGSVDKVWRKQFLKKNGLLKFLTTKKSLFSYVVKTANAQSCIGNFTCGQYQLRCSDGTSATCNFVNQDCGFLGGKCVSQCIAQGTSQTCGGYTGVTPSACQAYPGSECTSSNGPTGCVFAGSCTWSSSTPAPTPTPTPTPTPPPGCTCNDWVPIAQCGDTCGLCQRRYTRTCNPSGCAGENQCFDAAECLAGCNPTPTPPTGSGNLNVYGYHDGFGNSTSDPRTGIENQLLQTLPYCKAGGWAADPDNTDQDVNVRVLADGNIVASGPASGQRGDLGGVCTNATCAYEFNIGNAISLNTQHTIQVQAQDLNTFEWRNLYVYNGIVGSRNINCCGAPVTPTGLLPSGAISCTAGSINLTWGSTGSTTYAIEIDDMSTAFSPISGGNCPLPYPGDDCNNNVTGTSYPFTPVAGRQYRFRVTSKNACGELGTASAWSYFTKPIMTLSPASGSIAHPGTQTFDANFAPSGTTVGRVDFSVPTGGSFLSVSPTSDTTANPYRTTATSIAAGSATVRAQAYNAASGGSILCTVDAPVTVTSNAVPWWQVRGGDVVINGPFSSLIPPTCTGGCTPIFNLNAANSPATSYGNVNISSGSQDFAVGSGTGTGSQPQNQNAANVPISFNQNYNYDYFANKIPANVTPYPLPSTTSSFDVSNLNLIEETNPSACADGYCYLRKTSGNNALTLTGSANLTEKVLIFLDTGWLILGNNSASSLTLQDGTGFFAAFAKGGRIFVSDQVISTGQTDYRYEGLFFSNWEFRTSTFTPTSNGRISLRGSFVGLDQSGAATVDGIELRRTLTDSSATPAEHFEYAPELMMLFPPALMDRKTFWKEVVP